MKKLQHYAVGLLSIVLFLVVLSSSFFLIEEADHDCTGEDCAICAVMHATEELLHGMGGFQLRECVLALFLSILAFVIPGLFRQSYTNTLYSLRVRLND